MSNIELAKIYVKKLRLACSDALEVERKAPKRLREQLYQKHQIRLERLLRNYETKLLINNAKNKTTTEERLL